MVIPFPVILYILYIHLSAFFWTRTNKNNLRGLPVEVPLRVGSFYVGRVEKAGRLIGGAVYLSSSGLCLQGASGEQNYGGICSEYFEVRYLYSGKVAKLLTRNTRHRLTFDDLKVKITIMHSTYHIHIKSTQY